MWSTFFYVNIDANTSACACVRNKCVERLLSTVTAIEHWLTRCWVSTSRQHWETHDCVCVRLLWPEELVRQGRVCCFNPEVFTCNKNRALAATWKLLKLFPTLSDNHMERIHHFEGNFTSSGDQRCPLILFFTAVPSLLRHSFLCVSNTNSDSNMSTKYCFGF